VKNERGFALIISLLVVFLLTVIILEMDFQTRVDFRATLNFQEDLKASYVAKSALAIADAVLQEDWKETNVRPYDGLDEPWSVPMNNIPIGDGFGSVSMTDEGMKLNLNALTVSVAAGTATVSGSSTNTNQTQFMLDKLFEKLNIDRALVKTLVDWMDPDSILVGAGGAEACDDLPYKCKNKSFDTVAELRSVKGVTAEVYQAIFPYVTVSDMSKINLNTADPLILHTLEGYQNRVTASMINALIENRPVKDMRFFGSILDEYGTIISNTFSVVATGHVGNTKKTIHATIKRKINNATKRELLYFHIE